MKKLALLGAARPGYEKRVKIVLEKFGYCWSGWSYIIEHSKEEILKKQGSFNIYVHDIENPTDKGFGKGTGMVNYRLFVEKNNYVYDEPRKSPEPERTASTDMDKPHRLYVKIIGKPVEIPSQKWNAFIDYDKGDHLSGPFRWRYRNAEFGYIIDPYI